MFGRGNPERPRLLFFPLAFEGVNSVRPYPLTSDGFDGSREKPPALHRPMRDPRTSWVGRGTVSCVLVNDARLQRDHNCSEVPPHVSGTMSATDWEKVQE